MLTIPKHHNQFQILAGGVGAVCQGLQAETHQARLHPGRCWRCDGSPLWFGLFADYNFTF